MSTFLDKCEEAAYDKRAQRGLGGNTIVETRALQELVYHFKRLDEEIRSLHAEKEVRRLASLPECPTHPQ